MEFPLAHAESTPEVPDDIPVVYLPEGVMNEVELCDYYQMMADGNDKSLSKETRANRRNAGRRKFREAILRKKRVGGDKKEQKLDLDRRLVKKVQGQEQTARFNWLIACKNPAALHKQAETKRKRSEKAKLVREEKKKAKHA
jgi:hypothetical protein